MSSREIDFEDLVGGEYDFYGCAGQRFRLDDQVYEVSGDEDCAFFEVVLSEDRSGLHDLPIARVVVEHQVFNDAGYEFMDLHDDHEWLCFGTVASGDGYPLFIFEYTPKDMEN